MSRRSVRDWIFVVPVAVLAVPVATPWLCRQSERTPVSSAAAALLWVWSRSARFNPIQSTEPIFQSTRRLSLLDSISSCVKKGAGSCFFRGDSSFLAFRTAPYPPRLSNAQLPDLRSAHRLLASGSIPTFRRDVSGCLQQRGRVRLRRRPEPHRRARNAGDTRAHGSLRTPRGDGVRLHPARRE